MDQLETILKNTSHSSDITFTCTSGGGRGLLVQAWDIQNGGTLKTYRCEGENEASCICMAGTDYLLCALKVKPLVLVWKMDKEQVHLRFACNGLVNDMICDPSGTFCIGAIGEKINIWEVSSGLCMAQVSRHYQPISSLHFITTGGGVAYKGGRVFVSGGKDGLAIAWNMGNILSDYRVSHSLSDPNAPRPLTKLQPTLHIWSSHGMAVTGITSTASIDHTSNDHTSLCHRKIITVSLDHSCKFFDLLSGDLLCTLLFNAPLTSLTLGGEWLYVGVVSGDVIATPLFLPLEKVKEAGKDRFASTFKGHNKSITSLQVSSTGHRLISSSLDTHSKVWDINSTQLLLTINHKGPAVSSLLHKDVWRFSQLHSSGHTSSSLVLRPFQKNPQYRHDAILEHTVTLHRRPIHELSSDRISRIDSLTGEDFLDKFHYHTTQRTLVLVEREQGKNIEAEVNSLRRELGEMQEVNRALYSLALEHLLHEKTPLN